MGASSADEEEISPSHVEENHQREEKTSNI